ncbi:MAG: hypothetical protein WC989_04520 [Micavibrio sp.]
MDRKAANKQVIDTITNSAEANGAEAGGAKAGGAEADRAEAASADASSADDAFFTHLGEWFHRLAYGVWCVFLLAAMVVAGFAAPGLFALLRGILQPLLNQP